jgi:peptidoglycan/xylan/chitin deacetylase (PgdA/CDA1 family)
MPASVVPVLMYHHVSPTPGLITVSPAHFAAQMRWLKRQGYTTLTLDALAGFLAGEPVPAKSVVVSFDDGYLDNWVYAHPVLEQYGLHAVLFLITRWLGEGPLRPHAGQGNTPLPACLSHHAGKTAIDAGQTDLVMMRWSEVLAARDAGTFEFHSHTHTHNRWDKIYPGDADNKSKALAHDLASSRNLLPNAWVKSVATCAGRKAITTTTISAWLKPQVFVICTLPSQAWWALTAWPAGCRASW